MIDLKKYEGPYGIPVYHQQILGTKVACFGWLVMIGAADDESVGSAGLYHWFEHVPFRGTARFPNGTPDIVTPFTRKNGWVNAWTGKDMTNYFANVHESQWKEALARVTDMVAAPLLREADIKAERRIIHQEISQNLGNVNRCAWRELSALLYPQHPYSHDVLGSEESLERMDYETLVRAHEQGYDRSRMLFVSVGPMGIDELMEELIRLAPTLPNRGLSERRSAVFFGQPKWFTNTTLQVESTFATSVSKVLFPLDLDENGPKDTSEAAHTCGVLDSLFSYGGMASPMMRIVREERQLVYGISTDYDVIPGRSYFGFSTMSKRENVPAIIDSFNDVLKAPELDSKDRLEEMKECLSAEIEMMSADPTEFRSKAISQFRNYGRMIGYKEVIDRFNRITIEDIRRFRQLLDPDKAIIFIYRGMGKE